MGMPGKGKQWAQGRGGREADPPKPGERERHIIRRLQRQCDKFDFSAASKFSDFPLSKKSLAGLEAGKFVEPTEIQREAIGIALRGEDVLGAAKTGSGKTLAFVLPVLERLWREQWTREDGLGSLIISPTRELALQTFNVLKVIGSAHDFSAALIIGGTDYEYEKQRLAKTNIIVSTPGRLLQHMDENALFTADNLRILVLDEADRMLDMGFQRQLNAILDNLPPMRQTILFSATQTKSVSGLARLSLRNPVYVSVHEHAEHATPDGLTQSVVVCEEWEKVNMLWSFVRNHKHKKTLVFFASCKEVRFYHEAFRQMNVGMNIGALHGNLAHTKRTEVFETFCRKTHMTLLATDVAARGLDFPGVDWVVQLDCPADVHEYIHRSGRTARYKTKGEALLVLSPAQRKPFLEQLHKAKVPVTEIRVNMKKMEQVERKLAALCAADPKLHDFAKKCFTSYMRSVFFMQNKAVFDVNSIDLEQVAKSLGLLAPPRLRFLRGKQVGKKPKTGKKAEKEDSEDELKFPMEEPDDDLFTVKTPNVFDQDDPDEEQLPKPILTPPLQKTKKKKKSMEKLTRKILRNQLQLNPKKVFGEDGEEVLEEAGGSGEERFSVAEAASRMAEEDKKDAQAWRERIKARKKAAKLKQRKRERAERGEPGEDAVTLGPASEEDHSIHSNSDGYQSEDLPDEGGGFAVEQPDFAPPKKRRKETVDRDLEESLALKLLGAD